jgi:hypothetical protein
MSKKERHQNHLSHSTRVGLSLSRRKDHFDEIYRLICGPHVPSVVMRNNKEVLERLATLMQIMEVGQIV